MAVNRPSYMSSQWPGLPASNGNDGNKRNCDYYESGSIVTSGTTEQNPWYGIDLGMAVNVASVNFTNRADCCGIVNEHCLYNVK